MNTPYIIRTPYQRVKAAQHFKSRQHSIKKIYIYFSYVVQHSRICIAHLLCELYYTFSQSRVSGHIRLNIEIEVIRIFWMKTKIALFSLKLFWVEWVSKTFQYNKFDWLMCRNIKKNVHRTRHMKQRLKGVFVFVWLCRMYIWTATISPLNDSYGILFSSTFLINKCVKQISSNQTKGIYFELVNQ